MNDRWDSALAAAEFNREPPAMCTVMYSFLYEDEKITLDIIKTLVEHKANINIQYKHSKSLLILAAENKCFDVMCYLLSEGADLFLKHTYANGTKHKTALGVAYDRYILASYQMSDQCAKHAKKCLDLLVQAAADYLYREGFKQKNEELYIRNAIKDLAGNFRELCVDWDSKPDTAEFRSNSALLERFLEKNIKPAELAVRIKKERKERVHAFCMGSGLSKQNLEKKASIPPIYNFFQSDGEKDLARKIFSYIHPAKEVEVTFLPKKPRLA